jgi:hypothetical protein
MPLIKNKHDFTKWSWTKKYLSQKLSEVAENAPIFRSNLRKYKLKYKTKNKGKLFVHEKALIKMLRINKRIMRLLLEKELIQCMNISGLNIYTVADIERFLVNSLG